MSSKFFVILILLVSFASLESAATEGEDHASNLGFMGSASFSPPQGFPSFNDFHSSASASASAAPYFHGNGGPSSEHYSEPSYYQTEQPHGQFEDPYSHRMPSFSYSNTELNFDSGPEQSQNQNQNHIPSTQNHVLLGQYPGKHPEELPVAPLHKYKYPEESQSILNAPFKSGHKVRGEGPGFSTNSRPPPFIPMGHAPFGNHGPEIETDFENEPPFRHKSKHYVNPEEQIDTAPFKYHQKSQSSNEFDHEPHPPYKRPQFQPESYPPHIKHEFEPGPHPPFSKPEPEFEPEPHPPYKRPKFEPKPHPPFSKPEFEPKPKPHPQPHPSFGKPEFEPKPLPPYSKPEPEFEPEAHPPYKQRPQFQLEPHPPYNKPNFEHKPNQPKKYNKQPEFGFRPRPPPFEDASPFKPKYEPHPQQIPPSSFSDHAPFPKGKRQPNKVLEASQAPIQQNENNEEPEYNEIVEHHYYPQTEPESEIKATPPSPHTPNVPIVLKMSKLPNQKLKHKLENQNQNHSPKKSFGSGPPVFYAPSPDVELAQKKKLQQLEAHAQAQQQAEGSSLTKTIDVKAKKNGTREGSPSRRRRSLTSDPMIADGTEDAPTYWPPTSYISFDRYKKHGEGSGEVDRSSSSSKLKQNVSYDSSSDEQRYFPSFPSPYLGLGNLNLGGLGLNLNPFGRAPLFPATAPNLNLNSNRERERAPSRYSGGGSGSFKFGGGLPNRGPSMSSSPASSSSDNRYAHDNNLLGSGNFEVVRGGTYYGDEDEGGHGYNPMSGGPSYHPGDDDDGYYGHSNSNPYRGGGGGDFFANFRDFADINPHSRSFSHHVPARVAPNLKAESSEHKPQFNLQYDPMMATY